MLHIASIALGITCLMGMFAIISQLVSRHFEKNSGARRVARRTSASTPRLQRSPPSRRPVNPPRRPHLGNASRQPYGTEGGSPRRISTSSGTSPLRPDNPLDYPTCPILGCRNTPQAPHTIRKNADGAFVCSHCGYSFSGCHVI